MKSLMVKGFATPSEKSSVRAQLKELEAGDQEVVKDEVEAVEALPESAPVKEGEEAELKDNIEKMFKSATAGMKAGIVAELKSEVDAYFKSQKEAMDKKAGAFNGDVKIARKDINLFLKKYSQALLDNDVVALKEMTTDSANSPYAGFVTGRELSAEIRNLATTYGVARAEFATVQLSKNKYDANALVTDVTTYWVDQGAVIPSGQVVLGQESLELKKLGAIVTLTRELIEDEEIDLFSFIGTRVAQGFSQKEDKAFFTGAGAGDTANAEFTGALNAVGANEVVMTGDAFADLTADNLLDMQDKSPQYIAQTGKYYMHRSIRNILAKLKDLQGEYIYQKPTDNQPAMVWGKSIVEVEAMPSVADTGADTPFIIFGNLKISSILGYRGAISADRFNAGVVRNVANNADINLITTDREAIRWIERVGAITVFPEAITVLKTGSGS